MYGKSTIPSIEEEILYIDIILFLVGWFNKSCPSSQSSERKFEILLLADL